MSWTYTNPDNGETIEVYHTNDGEQAVHEPRGKKDPTPYHDSGNTGRRYSKGQVR